MGTGREWKVAVALALAIKLASLGALYGGWRLVDRAVYRDGAGKIVDLWMTRPDTGFIDNLANFDGAWHVRIAALGYRRLAARDYDLAAETKRLRVMDQLGFEQGRWPPEPGFGWIDRGYGWRHFPGLPGLIAAGAAVGLDPTRFGVVLVNLLSIGYAALLFKLARKDLGAGAAGLAVFLACFHPGAWSLSGLYTEPLFLFLSAATMLCARDRRWGLAGLAAMAAATTRICGLVLAAPLIYEWLEARAEAEGPGGVRRVLSPANLKGALGELWNWPGPWPLALLPAGFAAVLIFFHFVGGDALIWTRVHEANVHGRVNWPWLMLLETYRKGWVIAGKELPLHALLLAVLLLSAGRVRGSYTAWMALFFLYHVSNGNHSYLRYQVHCVPMFIALATLTHQRKWLSVPLAALFLLFFLFFGAMWINGYWVA